MQAHFCIKHLIQNFFQIRSYLCNINSLLMKPVLVVVVMYLFCIQSLKAQSSDSIPTSQSHRAFKKGLYAPATLIVAGIFASSSFKGAIKNEVVKERNEHFGHFSTSMDNYLQYSPIAIVYAL